ncbi:MAG: CbtA family protein [Actinomycetota bacterium]|nr:CbtA family protein [Actinomycetota bacterium]
MFRYVRHGALAGVAGGAATALFLLLVGQRSINEAIAAERAAGHGGDALFSRGVQQAGGALGAVLVGAALGSALAVVFAAVRHRLAGRDDFDRSVRLGAAAFVTVFLVPFLKYPANPPAVGDPTTAGRRAALYLVALSWSVVAAWAAWRLRRWLSAEGRPARLNQAAAVAMWLTLVGLGFAILPGSPDPVTLPASLIWRFRLASAGGQALFWAVTACAFGWLCLARATGGGRGPETPAVGHRG